MAQQAIVSGQHFTFFRTDGLRDGYYDRRRRLLVVVDPVRGVILSLDRKNERHVRNLRGSTYGR